MFSERYARLAALLALFGVLAVLGAVFVDTDQLVRWLWLVAKSPWTPCGVLPAILGLLCLRRNFRWWLRAQFWICLLGWYLMSRGRSGLGKETYERMSALHEEALGFDARKDYGRAAERAREGCHEKQRQIRKTKTSL